MLRSLCVLLLWLVAANASSFWSSCTFHHDASSRLRAAFASRLFGQDLAVSHLISQIDEHIQNEAPSKPLVLSLHGHTGTGKSFATKIIGAHTALIRIF